MTADVSEGDVLRAEMTGKTYRVQSIEDGQVYVSGIPPVSKAQLERDIERDKITVVG